MSKLRDRIREIARRRPAAFGFAAMRAAAQDRPRQILVIAEAAAAAAATTAVEAGADAVLCTGALEALASVVAVAGTTPVGLRIDAASGADATAALAAGADFLLFNDNSADATGVVETGLGYIAIVELGADDATIRLLRLLDLDAVLIAAPSERMTVRQQLQTRRIADLARKPLVAHAQAAVPTATLELWRDAGIAAVLVPASTAAALLAAAAEVAPPREPKKESRPDAILPAPRASDDDDEDDD